ncbi:RES domain-containing protein [Pseudomonas luteola]|uniref:RES family NAD+ phosphorylase n=1 Tax=Pseudomonas luteola TaxID=47886 RepID=UPI000F79B3BD|nr:RES family NAD+ phosphorylase [Pseudomonas luteola]RRW39749.1 RES domain-containing protein [Pseudomonas luteola]
MRGWRVAKERRATDLTGMGAAIAGGRWNHPRTPAVYMGLTPAICSLETFVHTNGEPVEGMKITEFELPEDKGLYLELENELLPTGWNSIPYDRPSMDFGTRWLQSRSHLGLIVPSAILPLERNVVINPFHPEARLIKVLEVYNFTFDPRMFERPRTPQ